MHTAPRPAFWTSLLWLTVGRLLVNKSRIVRERHMAASECELSSRCTCSPTPLMSITASFMARKSLMTSAAMSCPQSVGWGSNTDLQRQSSNTHRQHPKTNEQKKQYIMYIYKIRKFILGHLARLSQMPWPPYLAGSTGAPALRIITFRVTRRPLSPAPCNLFCTSIDRLVRKVSASST